MQIHILESADWPSDRLKQKIKGVIKEAYYDAHRVIPKSSDYLNFIAYPNEYDCIPETADGAYAHSSELIRFWFDPRLPYGETYMLDSLRATVFHEYSHVARYFVTEYDDSLLNGAITEGLATVFEREHSGSRKPLWGKYETDDKTMRTWLEEIIALKSDWSQWNAYAFDNPDGRRWIAYKTGTWLVDKALAKSKKTIAELTTLPAAEILKLAGES